MTTLHKYKPRYEGVRWSIVCPSYEGIQRFAIDELERAVQRCVPYVVAVRREALPGENVIRVGISDRAPAKPQSFAVTCTSDHVDIAGHDAAGVLYGVEEFTSRLTTLGAEWSTQESPQIESRGIWTWGYVIYDYRRFLDHMARLKLNKLTIWNDEPPLNSREIIDYAHSRGVQIVFGFQWGWGHDDLDLTNPQHRDLVKQDVLRNYRENYRSLPLDGIYFQTLTEHHNLTKNGRSNAAWACDWVNEIARALLKENPKLRIEFGLHATSIQQHYEDLRPLDPRVTIVWEDAGVIPFSYMPVVDFNGGSPEATRAFGKQIAGLQSEFAMVAKGWTNLDWNNEFEHHGPFILGERDPEWIRHRALRLQPHWKHINGLWEGNFPVAARFYRELMPKKMSVCALVEDGLLEQAIQPSVALFAETVWNPSRPDDELRSRASSHALGDVR